MAADMRSPNVSVTPINVEPPFAPGHGEPLDSSDAEVAQIDFESSVVSVVSMRHRGSRDAASAAAVAAAAAAPAAAPPHAVEDAVPRPMSWEGELSDGDGDGDGDGGDAGMCVDVEHAPENLSMQGGRAHAASRAPAPAASVVERAVGGAQESPVMLLKRHPPSGLPDAGGRYSLPKELAHKAALNVPPTPSPDSAVHSAYSVFSSPTQSPLTQRHVTLTPSLSRNNSDASHSSCCSYSSVSVSVSPTQQFSPTHSPIQGRHAPSVHGSPLHHSVLYRSLQDDCSTQFTAGSSASEGVDNDDSLANDDKALLHAALPAPPGISRQQLINSPCPICGDKISGFHYGIFSCESCKGFFKRTVQNRKNYVCLRGAACPVTVATRKKCPACRFEKCLQCGMKLEAIREDRTRGGRSTYQCSYSLPPALSSHGPPPGGGGGGGGSGAGTPDGYAPLAGFSVKVEPAEAPPPPPPPAAHAKRRHAVPPLLQEIMDVEHLWHYSELELVKLGADGGLGHDGCATATAATHNLHMHPLLAGTALAGSADASPDFVAHLCRIADHRLYKIVKWCKSLPLFKHISIDDQICLLINSWCELLLFSCCFRSMPAPGEIRVSMGKSITLAQARDLGMHACIERMLNFTDHLRRLRVDRYEYVAMKVIVLLTSDTSELREAERVRASQEKALKALQDYTLAHYPDSPAKFGELLLRIPELQRTCQVGKEMLTIKSKHDEGPSFNLLMELLRGDH